MTTAKHVIEAARQRGWSIATAESCTGGLIAAALTSVPGSSVSFLGGIVAYDNQAKHDLLNVSETLLRTHGAVSAPVAEAMAVGGREALGADICVSVTGIAGPSGGRPDKPVGTVYFGLATRTRTMTFHEVFTGEDRDGVRTSTVKSALGYLNGVIESQSGDIG